MEAIWTEVKDDMDEITLDQLLADIAKITDFPAIQEELPVTESIPTSPVFSDSSNDDTITEEELQQLEDEMFSVIEEMESEIQSVTGERDKLNADINEINIQYEASLKNKDKEIEETKASLESIENAWAKVQENPVLWRLVQDTLEWKEVNIPKIVEDKITEDIDSMPNIDWWVPVSVAPVVQTLQDVFSNTHTASFN